MAWRPHPSSKSHCPNHTPLVRQVFTTVLHCPNRVQNFNEPVLSRYRVGRRGSVWSAPAAACSELCHCHRARPVSVWKPADQYHLLYTLGIQVPSQVRYDWIPRDRERERLVFRPKTPGFHEVECDRLLKSTKSTVRWPAPVVNVCEGTEITRRGVR